ncbi:P-loop NTPase family protein [Rossellomorea aquimaris]|uniref:hypothetical protein n=1 Tax=Rossellomorea aquimaris TaxID=189382 RepID=UPI0007D0AEFB|nr:hypothetical protein [Rossellomorea aquimaris]
MLHKANRIHIIGSVASGKSTFARKLSSQKGIPYFELDNIMWKRDPLGDSRRNVEERKDILHSIVLMDSWIIEGVHYEEWINESLEYADTIVFLDTPIYKRNFRILKRFFEERLGFKQGNYPQTFVMLKKMYQWNLRYKKVDMPKVKRRLGPYKEKLFMVKG